MTNKKIKKDNLKNWIIGLIFLIVLIGSFYVAFHDYRLNKATEKKQEYDDLFTLYENKYTQIINLETKYSKWGMLYYTDFSDEDLEEYYKLIDEEALINEDIYSWLIINSEVLKITNDFNDLQIQKLIEELEVFSNQIQETKTKVSLILLFREEEKELEEQLQEELEQKIEPFEIEINSHSIKDTLLQWEINEYPATEGFEFHIFDITVYNKDNPRITSISFKIKNQEGYIYEDSLYYSNLFEDKFPSNAGISQNDFVRGKIIFEVKENSELIKLTLEAYDSEWNSITQSFDI